jgi:hypothetical protein
MHIYIQEYLSGSGVAMGMDAERFSRENRHRCLEHFPISAGNPNPSGSFPLPGRRIATV